MRSVRAVPVSVPLIAEPLVPAHDDENPVEEFADIASARNAARFAVLAIVKLAVVQDVTPKLLGASKPETSNATAMSGQ